MGALLDHPWWLLLLAAIGVVAIIAVALTLFSSFGDRPSTASVTKFCPVDSDDFLHAMAGTLNSPLQEGGTARLLNNGDEFVPCMLEAIRQAEHSVNFMTYIWEPGEMSDRFMEALTAKAREGVEVRVLIDALGGHTAPEDEIEAFRRSGGNWQWFHPPRFGMLTRMHRRNHRRAVVVDGHTGYTGGMAVSDKWLGNAQDPDHWRDCMVEVRGRIAANLQSAFAQLWSHNTGEMLIGPSFFPVQARPADGVGESISRHVSVISSPSAESHPLRRLFWFSFRSARRSIYITNPYFVPDDVMCAVLQERARAGVDVRVLLPNEHTDVPLIRWASHAYYEKLLRAGIRIYEYQPTMIHQKLIVVDGTWSVVGSANMDVRSKELNQENMLGILDDEFGAEVEAVFFADLERAEEIQLERWARRAPWRRLPEQISLLFEEQF